MMLEFLASQLGVFGPVAFVALVVLVVRWRRTTTDPRFTFLLLFVVPLLGAITLQALLSTAYANWAAPVYASASVAVAAFLLAGHRRWLLASVVVNLIFGLSLYAYEPVRLALALDPPKRLDPTFRVRGWPEIGAELARVRAQHPADGVLFEYGILAAQCLYQTPLEHDEVFYWNTEPVCRNHFELTNSLQTMIGRDLLFVSRKPHDDKKWLRRYFDSVEHLDPIEVRTHPDRVMTLHVSLARGFRGLPEDAFQAR
jgi:hypothetical protein